MSQITVPAGSNSNASSYGAPTGLVGTMAVQIIRVPDETVLLARTTDGVSETAPGVYTRHFTWPDAAGNYQVIWDYGVVGREAVDDVTVTPFDLVVPPGTYYCTSQDVRNEAAPRVLPQTDDEITKEILKACRDIDRHLSLLDAGDGSLRLAQYIDDFNVSQVSQLALGAAQQTLYRLHMGYAFFLESNQILTGKDYSTSKPVPKFSPLARDTLVAGGFLALAGRLWSGRRGGVYSTSQSQWSW